MAAMVLSPGVGYGHAVRDDAAQAAASPRPGATVDVADEVARLRSALVNARAHLAEHVREYHAPSSQDMHHIVAAHQLILEDDAFFGDVEQRIRVSSLGAEAAVEEGFGAAIERLLETDDSYLQSRVEDLRDSCHLVLRSLGDRGDLDEVGQGHAVVFFTPNLRPSAVLRARRMGAVAFVTSGTANASHAAILLRASGMPALGGVDLAALSSVEGLPILVDAIDGVLHIAPPQSLVEQTSAHAKCLAIDAGDIAHGGTPLAAGTRDGALVQLWANIDDPARMETCTRYRLHGVGLFRTEFLVLTDDRVPDEEEQVRIYQRAVDSLPGRPIILRTFDIGAEKVTPGLHERREGNPALGLRGLRRQLRGHLPELRTQLRAILRATVGHDAGVLVPMVTRVDDVLRAKQELGRAAAELARDAIPYNTALRVGAMLEVPAAVLGATEILAEVDFVCVGTNDLSQYLAAADRDDPAVSDYLAPETTHIFDVIAWLAERAGQLGRLDDVLIGGELASEPEAVVRLVQLGVRNLIIRPSMADAIRSIIAEIASAT